MGLLQGKVAVVTGAARGQGRSHCVRLAREGAAVIGVDVCAQIDTVRYPMSTDQDLDTTRRLVEEAGGAMLAAVVDVRDLVGLQDAVDAGVRRFGRLDAVVANAGITGTGPVDGLTEQEWDDMIGVNLSGVWRTVRATVPHLRVTGQGGSIVLISSAAGLKAMPNIAHYCAAKFGLVGLGRSMALELGPDRIRVNLIHPTQVDTPMIMNDTVFGLFLPDVQNPTREQFAAASQQTNALPVPWAEPGDISDAVVFLCSDASRFITGASLPVDAGMSLK